MTWAIIPIIAIAAPFCYAAYTKWLKFQKMKMNAPLTDEYVARLSEAEDELAAARRRIKNLESIVVNRLLDDPSGKEKIEIEASEVIARNTLK